MKLGDMPLPRRSCTGFRSDPPPPSAGYPVSTSVRLPHPDQMAPFMSAVCQHCGRTLEFDAKKGWGCGACD